MFRLPSFLAAFFLLGLFLTGASATGSSPGGTPMTAISGPQRPFTETTADMERRDRLKQASPGARRPGIRAEPLGRPGVEKSTPPGVEGYFPPPGSFLKKSPAGQAPGSAPQQAGVSFDGVSLTDQFNDFQGGSIPPDTMGAIGPNHFVEIINSSVAIFNRTGTRLRHVSLDSFFGGSSGAINFPRGGTFDPRVVFDRRSGRFFGLATERGNPAGSDNDVILAVSRTSDAMGSWDKYLIPVGDAGAFTDYPTLGVDDNGVYMGMTMFPNSGSPTGKIMATQKASLLASSPSLSSVFVVGGITDLYSSPQPALNYDTVGPTARAWIVASSTTVFANIHYRTISWSGGTPTLSATTVLNTPGFNGPINAPAQGSTTAISVGDDRLQMAIIRNNRLWTCRNAGLNASGGSGGADRTGCEWLELTLNNATASLAQSGRIFDTAASNPRFYYYPSLVVSGQGHMAIAFSGSSAGEFVGIYTTGRLAGDAAGTTGAVLQLKAGANRYQRTDSIGRNRWGDYSYTSLDPLDDMSIWTIQEYAGATADIWVTRIFKLLAPAPSMNNPNASVPRGTVGATVQITGSGFYDPGDGFAGRLTASITGGNPNGISNLTARFDSATRVTLTFDVAPDAQEGPRTVTLTNPDGQAVSIAGAITITAGGGGGGTPSVGMAASVLTVSETVGTATLTVTLSAASTSTVTVNYATADGTATAGADYNQTSGTLTFNPGETSRTLSVGIRTDNLLEANETFTVTLSAPSNANLGAVTTTTVTITDVRTGLAPSALSAQVGPGPQVELSWQDNTGNETGFQIERKTSASDFLPIGTVGAGVTSFADTNVQQGEIYTYRVRAFNDAGSTDPSNEAQVSLDEPGILRVFPFKLKFPGTRALSTSRASFRVENVGDGTLVVTVHEPADPFNVVENGGTFSLSPGESRMVTVEFAPQVKGKSKVELQVESNGGDARVLLIGKAKKPLRAP